MRKKYPDITIQPDSRCIVGSGGGNTVSGLAAARAGNVHSLRPAGPVIIQLAFARVSGYRRYCNYQYHIFSVWLLRLHRSQVSNSHLIVIRSTSVASFFVLGGQDPQMYRQK